MTIKPHLIQACLLGITLCFSIACGNSHTVANTGGISGTGDSNLAKTYQVESFDLVHSSYGTKSKNDFSLNTLAPVFKLVLSNERSEEDLNQNFSILITDTSNGSSLSLTDFSSSLKIVDSGDHKSFFLFIFKDENTSIQSKELNPGREYSYLMKPKEGTILIYEQIQTGQIQGSFTTKTITFTYPTKTDSNDSLIKIKNSPLIGITSLTPSFLIHSSLPIHDFDENDSSNFYGLSGKLIVSINGTNLLKQGLQNITVSEAHPKALKIEVLPSAGLNWGNQYSLNIEDNGLQLEEQNATRSLSDQELPSQIQINTQSL